MDNMNDAELFGKVLKVNYAAPMKIKGKIMKLRLYIRLTVALVRK